MFLNACNYNSKCHIIHETLRICKHYDRYTLLLRSEFRVNQAAQLQNREELFFKTKMASKIFDGMEHLASAFDVLK